MGVIPPSYLCTMKQKNFYIVRYYLNDKVVFSTRLTKGQSLSYEDFLEESKPNYAGGRTTWFRMDISQK